MARTALRSLGLFLIGGLTLFTDPSPARSNGFDYTIVVGTITKVTDNGDGTAAVEFTLNGTTGSATLDGNTWILLGFDFVSVADFVSTLNAPGAAQYFGGAATESGASAATLLIAFKLEIPPLPTIVCGTVVDAKDNGDGTGQVTFSKTNADGTTTTTDVLLDGNTKLVLNDEYTTLSAFVSAILTATNDTTLPQYTGRARIPSGATTASRVCVENDDDEG